MTNTNHSATPAACQHICNIVRKDRVLEQLLHPADAAVEDQRGRKVMFPRWVVQLVEAIQDAGQDPLKAAEDQVLLAAVPLFLAGRMQARPPILAAADGVIEPGEGAAPQTEAPRLGRVAQLQRPERPITFMEWHGEVGNHFPLLVRPAAVCLSVIAQLLLNDVTNPFALALVDVPSSGKTIILNFFDVPQLIYTTDNFTPAAFVSHASNIKRDELARVDLLPRIRYRTLVARDLAPLFGAKEDEVMKSLGILTRALDGEGLETDSGVHGKRGYRGDYLFMLLAGTTPPSPRVFRMMSHLGGRLFFLSLRLPAKTDAELAAQNKGLSWKQKQTVCQKATGDLLRSLWAQHPQGVSWEKEADSDQYLRVIARCAQLLACLRGAVNVWRAEHDERFSQAEPVIENPDRINCLLYNLARGHAVVCGREKLTTADLAPVLEVTLDSAPSIRAKLFRLLLAAGGTLRTSQIEQSLRCSKPSALKEMEILATLGVTDTSDTAPQCGRPERQIALAARFTWFVSPECNALRWPRAGTQGGIV